MGVKKIRVRVGISVRVGLGLSCITSKQLQMHCKTAVTPLIDYPVALTNQSLPYQQASV
jgi:hypothetical protein